MKGQKSLEMIIGLIMLLVVASVTISMFLNVFQKPELGQQTREKQEIINACSTMCNDWQESQGRNQLAAAVQYCTAKFTRDANGNGVTTDVAGAGYNSYCEDGTHCFNVHTCTTGVNKVLNAQRCRQIMCEYYTKINNDPYNASKEGNVHEHIRGLFSPNNEKTGIGTCGLADATDSAGYELATWYSPRRDNFTIAGPNPIPKGGKYVCEPRFAEFADSGDGSGDGTGSDGGGDGPPDSLW